MIVVQNSSFHFHLREKMLAHASFIPSKNAQDKRILVPSQTEFPFLKGKGGIYGMAWSSGEVFGKVIRWPHGTVFFFVMKDDQLEEQLLNIYYNASSYAQYFI